MTLEELCKEINRSPNTLKRSFNRTVEVFKKKGIIISRISTNNYEITYDSENNVSEISTTKDLDDNKKTVTKFGAAGDIISETTYQNDQRITGKEYSDGYRYEITYTNDRPDVINIYENATNVLVCEQHYSFSDTLRTVLSEYSDGSIDIVSTYLANDEYNIAQQDIIFENNILKSFTEINMNTYEMFTISDIYYDAAQNLILYKKHDEIFDTDKYYTILSTTGIPTKQDIENLTTNMAFFDNSKLANCTINGVTYVSGEIQVLTDEQKAFLNTIDGMRTDLSLDDIQASSITFSGNNNVTFATKDGKIWTCSKTNRDYTILKTEIQNEKYEQATYNSSKQLTEEIIVDTSNDKTAKTTKKYNATSTTSTLSSQQLTD